LPKAVLPSEVSRALARHLPRDPRPRPLQICCRFRLNRLANRWGGWGRVPPKKPRCFLLLFFFFYFFVCCLFFFFTPTPLPDRPPRHPPLPHLSPPPFPPPPLPHSTSPAPPSPPITLQPPSSARGTPSTPPGLYPTSRTGQTNHSLFCGCFLLIIFFGFLGC